MRFIAAREYFEVLILSPDNVFNIPEVAAIVGVLDVVTDSIKHLLRSVNVSGVKNLCECGR